MHKRVIDLWYQAWSQILVEMAPQEINWLVRGHNHITLLTSRRVVMIVSRVRLMAGLFAVLTPLWIIADILAFNRAIWVDLVLARIVATFAFMAILLSQRKTHSLWDAYSALAMLFAVPTAFFLFSYHHMAQFEMQGIEAAFATGYGFLPFVMLAGLSIFPLTLFESVAFATPLLGMELLAALMRLPRLDWPPIAATFWLLMLIAAVAALAGISQLAFMIVLVRESIRDGLTGCFSRQSGEELLELQFILARRSGTPLSLAFIDLDHFKSVNDTWGHDAGDKVLMDAVAQIKSTLRVGDILIRWGGEEFVLVMPNASAPKALHALNRMRLSGLGSRPDGMPITASIGLAELQADGTDDWPQLIEIADSRMYTAKHTGRNRIVDAG